MPGASICCSPPPSSWPPLWCSSTAWCGAGSTASLLPASSWKRDILEEVRISLFQYQTNMTETHSGSGARVWSDEDFLRAFEDLSFPAEQFHHREHLRSEEHTSELQSHLNLVCRLLLEKKKHKKKHVKYITKTNIIII